MHRSTHWAALLASGLLTAGLLSACALPGLGSSASEYEGPAQPDIRLEQVWQNTKLPMGELASASIAGDSIVMSGGTGTPFITGVMVADAATGKLRWTDPGTTTHTLPNGDRGSLFGDLVVASAGKGVLTSIYYLSPCPGGKPSCSKSETTKTAGRGVVGLGLTDGKPRWAITLVEQVSNSDPRASEVEDTQANVMFANDDVVIAVLGAELDGRSFPEDDGTVTTIALDPATGRELWRIDEVLPSGLSDGFLTAVAKPTDGQAAPGSSGRYAGRGLIVDVRSGQTRWIATDRKGQWTDTAEGLGIFKTDDGQVGEELVVNLADSATVLSGKLRIRKIGRDGSGVFVAWNEWKNGGQALLSQGVGEAKALRGSQPLDGRDNIRDAVGGYVWVGRLAGGGSHAIDRTGAVRSPEVDGHILAMDGRWMVVSAEGSQPPYRVYRVS